MNTRVNRDTAGGRALKPYMAIAALVVVAAVVGFSLAERWLVGPPSEDEALTETSTGGGRVVIGRPERSSVPPVTPQENAPAPDASYKSEEFTFYKSLGGTSATEPTLTPSRPPSPPAKSDVERAARPGPSKTYTLQVGSFQDRRAADRLAARVRRYRHV
ncbi:MAG: SPOR domain-containing protein, partial [Nitrospiria bacterium]